MGLFDALGLDLKILLAQLINFSVLIFVLWRFAYKPILKILKERREKVVKGVEAAEEAEKKLVEAELKEKEIITNAKKESLKIIAEAKDRAEIKYKEIIAKSKEDIGLVINEEKEKIRLEKEKTLADIRQEISSLLTIGVSQFLDKKIDSRQDTELIREIADNLPK